jgi:hypothetical protein
MAYNQPVLYTYSGSALSPNKKVSKIKIVGFNPQLEASNQCWGIRVDINSDTYYYIDKYNLEITLPASVMVTSLDIKAIRFHDGVDDVVADIGTATIILFVED